MLLTSAAHVSIAQATVLLTPGGAVAGHFEGLQHAADILAETSEHEVWGTVERTKKNKNKMPPPTIPTPIGAG